MTASTRTRPGSPSTGAVLRIVYTTVLLAFLDTFALLPVLGPYAREIGAGAVGIGIVIGAYSASGLVFNVLGGYLLDRVGRRPLVVVGGLLAAGSLALYAVAASTASLVALRLLHGAGGGLLVPALFTLAGDLAPFSGRGRAMGRVGALIGVAAVAGPALAGPLRSLGGFPAVFWSVAAALVAGVVLVLVFVPETSRAAPGPVAEASPSTRSLLGRADLRLAVAAVFGFTTSFGILVAFLPNQVEADGASAVVSGMLFTLVSGIAALLMLSSVARWVDRSGVVPPVRAGMTCFVLALALLLPAGSLTSAVVASAVFGVGFGILFPAATGTVAMAAPTAGRGRAFGLFSAAYGLGFVVGPPLAGAIVALPGTSPYLLPLGVCVVVLSASGRRTTSRP